VTVSPELLQETNDLDPAHHPEKHADFSVVPLDLVMEIAIYLRSTNTQRAPPAIE